MKNGTQAMNEPDRWAGSLALVRATIDAVESPIAVVDSEGKVLLVNESWESNPSIRVDNIRTATDRIVSANNWNVDSEEATQFAISLDRVLSGQHRECRLRAEGSGSLREQTLIRARRLSVGQAAAIFVVESGAESGSKNSTANKEIRPPVAFFQCDLKGEIVGWSASAEDIFGTSERDTVGRHISFFFARKAPRFPDQEIVAALSNGERKQFELRMKRQGETFFGGTLMLAMPSGGDGSLIHCQVWLTSERQRSVGVLRRSEERLRYALEAASDGLWDWDLKTDDIVFSARVSEIFEETTRRDDARSAHTAMWKSRIHPDDDDARQRLLQLHLEGHTPAFESEYRIRTALGKWKWVVVRGRVTERNSKREPVRMIGTITDISERKFAQEALQRSEEQYRSLFEYASDAVVLFDPDTGRVRDVNEKAEQLLGYSSNELRKMVVRDLHPSDQWDRVENALTQSRTGNSSLYEVDGQTRDGKRIPLEANTRLISYGGQQVYQSFIRDISERRTLEQQLRHSQKMETVGRLAGGVAHDFNNLLTAIQGYTALLQSALPEGSEEREMTEEVFSAVQRASRLTMQLLTFSRHEIPNPLPLDLNAIVDELEKMLRRLIGEHVELEPSLSPTLGQIEGDRSRIEQVITNLVINAADAMPDGGRLTIRTENVHIDHDEAHEPAAPEEGSYALLTVKDEGQGMDADTLSQIFEPFFTTKPRGSGTGLGLATVYGIVKQSDGHISVDSEPGKGTTFRIYLPIRASRREVQVRDYVVDAPRRGKETVLIVEDEPAVRRLTRRFLETSGYKVIEASDVGDAIRMAEDDSETIDLLLTDVIMPELSGPELAKRLRALVPTLKVLYMSGYPGEFIARHGLSDTEMDYLQKPFSQETLTGRMREVLDA